MSRHALLMVLGCAIPLGVIFALPYVSLTRSSSSLLLIVALCPLLHLLLMARHGRRDRSLDSGTRPSAGGDKGPGTSGEGGSAVLGTKDSRGEVPQPAPNCPKSV